MREKNRDRWIDRKKRKQSRQIVRYIKRANRVINIDRQIQLKEKRESNTQKLIDKERKKRESNRNRWIDRERKKRGKEID